VLCRAASRKRRRERICGVETRVGEINLVGKDFAITRIPDPRPVCAAGQPSLAGLVETAEFENI
jgi:hypothetical protein